MTGKPRQTGSAPSRIGLFIPFIIFGVAIAVYAAYWFWTSGEIRRAGENWIAQQEAEGYVIAHEGIEVTGFPFRFTVNVRNPDIAAPADDGGWRARFPVLSASALPYNVTHWIVAFRAPAIVELPASGGVSRYTAMADTARLSLAGRKNSTIRIGAELANARLVNDGSGEVIVDGLESLVLSGLIEEDDRLRLRMEVNGLTLGEGQLDSASLAAFGQRAERLRVDAALTSWSALAADANLAHWSGNGGRLEITGAQMDWGAARLSGDGALGVDDLLRPEGRLSVMIAEPETLVGALVSAGILSADQGEAVRLALMMAPRREGGVALPFRLQQGGVFLGPARIGDVSPLAGPLPAPLDLPELPVD
ncbi:MAG: DUF2125 domain-containing protein [Glycocaulis sp.]